MITPLVHGSFSEKKLRKRALREQPRLLADAPEGEPICVRGIVRAFAPLIDAPLAGSACVYYQTHLAVGVAGRLSWRPHTHTSGGVAFVVADSAGTRAVVDPTSATVSVRFDTLTRSAAAFDADVRQSALLDLRPISVWFEIDAVHYYEGVIKIGSTVAILGTAAREPDPHAREAGDYRQAPSRLRFAGSSLIIANHPDE